MKSNFHLKSKQENKSLHIHLHGIFDGASAFELIQVIAANEKKVARIYVDTSQLTQTLPFGSSILDTHLPKNGLRPKLYFSGIWADKILPEGCALEKECRHKGACRNCQCRKITERQPSFRH